ncbi:hypothetical protein ABID58_007533 [Bradyrhizobium sp. S3.2.6]
MPTQVWALAASIGWTVVVAVILLYLISALANPAPVKGARRLNVVNCAAESAGMPGDRQDTRLIVRP